MIWRSRIERARRSMRVTTSVSPGWMKSRMVRSSGRPARVVPSPVSVRTMVQPAASSAAICASRFWSAVETLA